MDPTQWDVANARINVSLETRAERLKVVEQPSPSSAEKREKRKIAGHVARESSEKPAAFCADAIT